MCEAAKDRISGLPDSLLHHIHSFLEIKRGARTSVLSKRWNYIWTTVPTLDFQQNPFDTISKTEKFMDFVDGTLHRRNSSNIDKFSLVCCHHLNESRLHSWISTAIRGNVKELELDLNQKHPFCAPISLFTCESLVSLKLGGRINNSIRLPKYISFPRLKHLELSQFKFEDDCWNEELFSNSPALEEVILTLCFVNMSCFCISIPTLKLLRISTWSVDGNGIRDCVFKIDAPRLVTFSYSGFVAKELVLSSFPELVNAAVDFFFEENDGAQLRRLLQSFAHVECLAVFDETLEAIYFASDLLNNLPPFHNVKMLNIFDHLTTDQGLIALLEAMPNLELVIFDQHMDGEIEEDSDLDDENDSDKDDENDSDEDNSDNENDSDEDNSDGVEGDEYDDNEDIFDGDSVEEKNDLDNEHVGDVIEAAEGSSNDVCKDNYGDEDDSRATNIVTTGCLFPRLNSVCFKQFVGNPREMKWVKQILRDAEALQMITIHYYSCHARFVNARSETDLMVEIPSFPRASAGCVFKFFPSDHDNDNSEGSGEDADSVKGENNHGNDEEIDCCGSGEDADSVEGENNYGNDEEMDFSDDSEDESWR